MVAALIHQHDGRHRSNGRTTKRTDLERATAEQEPDRHEVKAAAKAHSTPSMQTPSSLDDLAEKVNALHQRVGRHVRSANELALEIGSLLLKAKRKLNHGQFGDWLAENVEVAEAQARRYMRLTNHRQQLDELHPNWATELTISEAIDLLAKPRMAADEMQFDPRWNTPSASERARSGAPAKKPGPMDITPEQLAERLKQAKAEHREKLERLPDIVSSLSVQEGGAVRDLQHALAAAAWRIAEGVLNPVYEGVGYDRHLITMGLVHQVLTETSVKDLFEPDEQQVLWSL